MYILTGSVVCPLSGTTCWISSVVLELATAGGVSALGHDLLDFLGGVGAGDRLGVIEELLVLNLGVLADLDADALKELHDVIELLRVDGARQLVSNLVEGKEALLAAFLGKNGNRGLLSLLSVAVLVGFFCLCLGVLADADALAPDLPDDLAQLCGICAFRKRSGNLADSEVPLLPRPACQNGYRQLSSLLTAVFFILHVTCHSVTV